MKSRPGSAFEVVQPELFLELLVRLFTDPSCLDGSGQPSDGGIARQVLMRGAVVVRDR